MEDHYIKNTSILHDRTVNDLKVGPPPPPLPNDLLQSSTPQDSTGYVIGGDPVIEGES